MMDEQSVRRFWRNLALLLALWCIAGACAVVVVVIVLIMMIKSMGW